MKFDNLENTRAALVGKVVVFNKLCESDHECDVDAGMKGRVKSVTMSNDFGIVKIEIDLTEFESHNDPLMKPTYYDKNGKACLTMKEAGFYHGYETVYTEAGFVLPFDLENTYDAEKEQKIQKLVSEYRPSMDIDVLHSWAAELVDLLKKKES